MVEKNKKLTNNFGKPIDDDQNSITVGVPGPTILEDIHVAEKLAHFNRERIPERVVHAKGAGAGGYFEVTHDVTKYTRAKFLSEIGKRTEVFVRFSTVGGEKGSADSARDPRGFAVKFYTEEGNYDMVGNNTPVFFIRDVIKFPDFIHTQKRVPQTNLKSDEMQWDFWSLVPESLHQVTILFSDRGTPKGYAHINGYGSHTYSFINDKDERFWVKFHFKTAQGIENFSAEEASRLTAEDSDWATRDLFERIERGDYPKWNFKVQIMPEEEAATYRWNPFDLTKVWPHKDYPLIDVGVVELNRNPANYFTDIEQAAFAPSNIVPGISFSPDKMLQARIFSYADAHRYRLGVNHHQLPVNQAKNAEVANNQRDGYMRYIDGGPGYNYEPDSFGGPKADPAYREPPLKISGDADRYDQPRGVDDDYIQPGNLFRLMTHEEQERLMDNIAGPLGTVSKEIQKRMIEHFTKADPKYGKGVKERIGV